jgi:hypothetical protein
MLRSVTTRLAGLVILIAGLWGGLIPFVGPYFHFALGPDHTWTWTNARFVLDVLPAIAAVLGGLILFASGPRLAGRIGALLALAGGAWFAVGPDVSRLWHAGGAQGIAHGSGGKRMLEYLTFHSGLGVLIVAFAAYALPGLVALRRPAAEDGAVGAAAPVERRRLGFGRRRRAVEPVGEPTVAEREAAARREGVTEPARVPAGDGASNGERVAEPGREQVGAPERR